VGSAHNRTWDARSGGRLRCPDDVPDAAKDDIVFYPPSSLRAVIW
jgi:hypothetical protein